MSSNLDMLLLNASLSLSNEEPVLDDHLRNMAGLLTNDLLNMLRARNGFYALESALHVFPSQANQQEFGLDKWNNEVLWRSEYKDMANGCLFFAEDLFGGQFCIKNNKIYTFDPESGVLDYLSDDIEGWAKEIVNDYEVLTGYRLAHQWQKQHGQLPVNKRLLPKIPFVVGGEFTLNNLYLSDAVEGMRFRANLANQIKNLPDGTNIKFNIVD